MVWTSEYPNRLIEALRNQAEAAVYLNAALEEDGREVEALLSRLQ